MSSKTASENKASSSSKTEKAAGAPAENAEEAASGQLLPFPITSELNGRVRRLITAYQREFKKEEAKKVASDKRNERRERIEQVIREREQQKIDMQQKKWTKKEELDFLNTILSFGVEYSRREKRYVWDRFRQLARLERKFDDSVTEYYLSFMAMCKRVVGRKLSEAESGLGVTLDPISPEKAQRVLDHVEKLRKIRDDILPSPYFRERTQKCDTALDLPSWWVPGKHDRDLVRGVAKHGLGRLDYYVLNDPDLSFKDVLKRALTGESLLDKKAWADFLKRRKPEEVKEEEEKMEVDEAKTKVADKEEEEKEEKAIVETNKDEKKKGDSSPTPPPQPKEAEKEKEKEGKKKDKLKEDRESKKAAEKDSKADKEKDAHESSKEPKEEKRTRKRGRKSDEPKPPAAVEEIKETRSRRKSTKEATQATKLAIEASKMARTDREKEKDKKDGKKDKSSEEKGKERLEDVAEEEEEEKEKEKEEDPKEEPEKEKEGKRTRREKRMRDAKRKEQEKQAEAQQEEKEKEEEEVKPVIEDAKEKKESEKEEETKVEQQTPPKPKEVKKETPRKKEAPKQSLARQRGICVYISAPQISAQQMDQIAKGGIYDIEIVNELMAQQYAANIKWPKEKILEIRLEHIMDCVEKNEWRYGRDYPLGDHLIGEESPTASVPGTPEAAAIPTPSRETSTPMSEISEPSFTEDPNVLTHSTTSSSVRKRQRGRRPIDFNPPAPPAAVEEKSKIKAILSQPTVNSHQSGSGSGAAASAGSKEGNR